MSLEESVDASASDSLTPEQATLYLEAAFSEYLRIRHGVDNDSLSMLESVKTQLPSLSRQQKEQIMTLADSLASIDESAAKDGILHEFHTSQAASMREMIGWFRAVYRMPSGTIYGINGGRHMQSAKHKQGKAAPKHSKTPCLRKAKNDHFLFDSLFPDFFSSALTTK